MQPFAVQSGVLTYGQNKIHCLRMGHGRRLAIALHGFGNHAGIYECLARHIGDAYTIVAPDLPGHGRTAWQDKYLDNTALAGITERIRLDFGAETVTLIGYSLGGRIALCILETIPERVDKLVLLASDGLRRHFWYHFATRNFLGKILFRKLLSAPGKYLKALSFLTRLRLVNASLFSFVRKSLLNERINAGIRYVWPVTSRLIPRLSHIKRCLKRKAIPVHVFSGRNDQIFPPQEGQHFIRNIPGAQQHLLDTGHFLFDEKSVCQIARTIRSDT